MRIDCAALPQNPEFRVLSDYVSPQQTTQRRVHPDETERHTRVLENGSSIGKEMNSPFPETEAMKLSRTKGLVNQHRTFITADLYLARSSDLQVSWRFRSTMLDAKRRSSFGKNVI
jgi:hypothetical protein